MSRKFALRQSRASGSTKRLVERIADMLKMGRTPIPRRKFVDEAGNELPPENKRGPVLQLSL